MAFTDHSFQKPWYTFTSSNKDTQRFVAALKHTMWNINSALPISQVALGLPCLNLLTGVDSKPKFFIYASTSKNDQKTKKTQIENHKKTRFLKFTKIYKVNFISFDKLLISSYKLKRNT